MTADERRKAQARLASFVAAEVEAVLAQHTDVMRRQTRISAGQLSGHVAAAMTVLSRRQHQAIDTMQDELADLARGFVANLAAIATKRFREDGSKSEVRALQEEVPIGADANLRGEEFEHGGQGNGLGSMIIEDWAGPVAGPTYLEATFGIPRSTLYRWQQRNEVVALLKGGRKFVFPIAQFVDGRPAAGVSAVLSILGHPRLTWFWLTQPCSPLANRKPIELLRIDRVDEVIEAAHSHQASEHGKPE